MIDVLSLVSFIYSLPAGFLLFSFLTAILISRYVAREPCDQQLANSQSTRLTKSPVRASSKPSNKVTELCLDNVSFESAVIRLVCDANECHTNVPVIEKIRRT